MPEQADYVGKSKIGEAICTKENVTYSVFSWLCSDGRPLIAVCNDEEAKTLNETQPVWPFGMGWSGETLRKDMENS